MSALKSPNRVRVVVATTVMLSFISFWRAAAIVLNDLGSSAFYAGGIAEDAVGKSAPWFILAVMLFSYAVRALYIESSTMFTRGGVYRVVKEAMGGTLAKLSVSALLFDFVLTGPISGVAAGQYIVGLFAQTVTYFGHPWQPSEEATNYIAALIAIAVTVYFWWRNIKGIHESSDDALRIMYVTTAMVVIMILWGVLTLIEHGGQLPPLPSPGSLSFDTEKGLGWLSHWHWFVQAGDSRSHILASAPKLIGLIGILIAFGHSVLAMSGEETLAQVNRELEHPKLKNLQRAGMVIFAYSLLFTSLVSFFAVALIPDAERPQYLNNLISGLAMNFVGPFYLRLAFQAFVVIVGFLMLAGAVNTAIIGSNGVLNRISEDGVLTDWFRAPQKKYGTTYRIINLIAILQIVTIVGSRGNIFYLGEAYAFGLMWSFAFNAVATLVLRYKHPQMRLWKVPLNLKVGRREVPLGLMLIAAFLVAVAIINLFTKEYATIYGTIFTAVFFAIFTISERRNRRKLDLTLAKLDRFQLQHSETISQDAVGVRPGNVLVAARDYNTLAHLEYALDHTDTEAQDIVVMTVRVMTGDSSERGSVDENLFAEYEQRLFTRVVALAEKHGKPVDLLIVSAANVFDAVAQTAVRLDSAQIVAGQSAKMTAQEQARELGRAWERLVEKPRRQVEFRVIGPGNQVHTVYLGAHAPRLTDEDLSLIHEIWLQVSQTPARQRVHHRDVVRVALERLKRDLKGRADVMLDFYQQERKGDHEPNTRSELREPETSRRN
ncbi:MAG TPA: APC family permease [Blastocatellia bacterium]|nr:APC family permease [Blastocatellia bacterium]